MVIHKVWEENQHLLRSIASAILGRSGETEDVLQETYRKLLHSRIDIKDSEQALFYLKRSVRNTAIDWNRKYFRKNLAVKEQVNDYERLEELYNDDENPLTLLLQKERESQEKQLSREVFQAIKTLPQIHQEAIKSFFRIDDCPPPKILSRERGIPYSTLRSRMLRGIDLIREILSEKSIPGFVKKERETLLTDKKEGNRYEMRQYQARRISGRQAD